MDFGKRCKKNSYKNFQKFIKIVKIVKIFFLIKKLKMYLIGSIELSYVES